MPKRKIDKEAAEFGARLVKLLEDQKIPRRGAGAYLHRKYGVSNVTANDWLNGKFKPEHETARKIAVDHGTDFDTLYFDKPTGRAAGEPDERSSALKIARLENDIHALNIALGTLMATMVQHRPAEAAEAASALRQHTPPEFLDRGVIRELVEVLETAKAARGRGGKPPSSGS